MQSERQSHKHIVCLKDIQGGTANCAVARIVLHSQGKFRMEMDICARAKCQAFWLFNLVFLHVAIL